MTSPSRPNLTAGVLAAIAGALVGAIAWAVLVFVTDYKIGFAAVGVGALAGFLAGRVGGGAPQLPVIAAVIGLLGCVAGDVFIASHALAEVSGLSSFTLLTSHTRIVWEVYKEEFDVLTLVFYGIAASAAFRLAKAHGLAHQQQPATDPLANYGPAATPPPESEPAAETSPPAPEPQP